MQSCILLVPVEVVLRVAVVPLLVGVSVADVGSLLEKSDGAVDDEVVVDDPKIFVSDRIKSLERILTSRRAGSGGGTSSR